MVIPNDGLKESIALVMLEPTAFSISKLFQCFLKLNYENQES